jgi:hypothetical protein
MKEDEKLYLDCRLNDFSSVTDAGIVTRWCHPIIITSL